MLIQNLWLKLHGRMRFGGKTALDIFMVIAILFA